MSGDHATDDESWIRILPGSFGMPLPAVMAHHSQFVIPLEQLGFELLSAHDPDRGYTHGRLIADVHSRHDVDFLLRPHDDDPQPPGTEPPRIAGAVFTDPHADIWWNAVHRERQMFLLVADRLTPFLDGSSNKAQYETLMNCHATLCPLALRAWSADVGTARPDQ